MSLTNNSWSIRTIVLLALLQVLCASYFLTRNFYLVNSFLFLSCGIGIGICILFVPFSKFSFASIWNTQSGFKVLVLVALLPFSYHFARQILDGTSLNIEYADMLPIIAVMCRRFLLGHWMQVYQPIPEIWGGIRPIYLPALWLPFSFSFLFHFDMRWITVSAIWLSVMICIIPAWKKSWLILLYSASMIILLAWLHFNEVNNVIRLTEEGVVFFYYTLMVLAIVSRNPWFLGVSAALCLLSRYAIIGWIPFAAFYFLTGKQYSFLWKSAVAGGLTCILLVFPFGWKSLLFQFELPQRYIEHGQRVWKENPEYFLHSLGMAKFFTPGHLQSLHYILITGSFLVPLVFLFLIRKRFAQVNILLAGFQIAVTFFYNFLDVSYLYLYYTPVFVSLAIAGWAMSKPE